jgi:ABC-2 type transport system ATP-binding protein
VECPRDWVGKRYSAVTAVRDISFSIRRGEILGFLGPNGAGKSTVVKMVTGLVDPTHGAVLFHGHRPTMYSRESRRTMR